MPKALHVLLLRLFRRLPTWWRRRVVRTVSPSYTVGSMCFVERANGDLLLVRQLYRTHWGVPGGLAERGEGPADTARREVFEETGLAIELVGEPCVVVEPDPQRVDIVYRAALLDEAMADGAEPRSPEITDLRWFPPDALPELQAETATALVTLARSRRLPEVGAWPSGSESV